MSSGLAEGEARGLVQAIVVELHRLGADVKAVTVQRDGDGLLFLAHVNGRTVFTRTEPGTTTYRAVADAILGSAAAATVTLH
jgi:hypothetical protein